MAKTNFRIALNDTNVYLYKTYVLRRPARRWRRVLCCAHSAPPADNDAVPVFTDSTDIDHTWTILLLGTTQCEMRSLGKASLQVCHRSTKTPLFSAHIQPVSVSDVDQPQAADISYMDIVGQTTVADVLRMSIINSQPTDSAVRLPDGRSFLIRCLPVYGASDVMAGAIWKASEVTGPTQCATVLQQARAAVFYDKECDVYIVNETWIRQRHLIGGLLADETQAAVIMISTDGRVEYAAKAHLIQELCRSNAAPSVSVSDFFAPIISMQLCQSIKYLAEAPLEGTVMHGISLGNSAGGFVVHITKMIAGVSQIMSGFVMTITRVDTMRDMIHVLQSVPLQSVPPSGPLPSVPPLQTVQAAQMTSV